MKAGYSVRSEDSLGDNGVVEESVTSLCDGAGGQQPICESVAQAVERYLTDLDGTEPVDLYALVLCEVERPLLQAVMKHSCGNRSKASRYLGMSRNTLQKKLAQYQIDS
ncbi:MAG TPA: Fis family transcriptional regulator [Gammaproteobacteria bacterium]|nr:Fis family transcriptional regulator [Gammaproteobacteria bacterium]